MSSQALVMSSQALVMSSHVMPQRRGHVTHNRQRMISHTCNACHEVVMSHMWEFTSSGSERNGSSAYLKTNPEMAQAARKKVLSLLSGARAYLIDRHFIRTHLLQVVFRCCSARASRDAFMCVCTNPCEARHQSSHIHPLSLILKSLQT